MRRAPRPCGPRELSRLRRALFPQIPPSEEEELEDGAAYEEARAARAAADDAARGRALFGDRFGDDEEALRAAANAAWVEKFDALQLRVETKAYVSHHARCSRHERRLSPRALFAARETVSHHTRCPRHERRLSPHALFAARETVSHHVCCSRDERRLSPCAICTTCCSRDERVGGRGTRISAHAAAVHARGVRGAQRAPTRPPPPPLRLTA